MNAGNLEILFVIFAAGVIWLALLVALLCMLALPSPRRRKRARRSRPGYVQVSPHVYVPASPGTDRTPQRTETSTGYRIQGVRAAFTAGHGALADRLKTQSPTTSGSATESNRGAPMTVVEWTERFVRPPVESPWRSNAHPHTDQ